MRKLYRYPKKGFLGGVCFGMGVHTNIDPIIWRVLTIFSGFAIIYNTLNIVSKCSDDLIKL